MVVKLQEEIEQKTFNIMISTTKLSARTVLRAVKAAFRLYQSKASQGKQSVRTLLRQNRGVSSVEISKTGIRGLERYMELNFIKCGDYYIPDIKLKNPNIRLGKWGRMRKEYLRLANPVLFSDMVLNETLYEHCAEIEETAKKRMEIIVPQLAKAYGVTEQLKAENQIEWVRQMNACVAQAEEAIKGELIYC